MESSVIKKHRLRRKRTVRVRKHLRGTAQKPRLCVVKTNSHIHVQIIDDENGVTLAGKSTCSKDFADANLGKRSKESAKKLGEWVAERAKELNVNQFIFDRGHSRYHGVLAELADAARSAGLQF